MSVTEAERAVLRTALIEEIGEESADILMRSTLPEGPDQLATKDDLNALETRVGGEFAKVQGQFEAVHAKMDGGFEAVHAKIDGGFAKVQGQFEAVHAKIDGGFEAVQGQFEAVHAKIDGGFAELKGHMDSAVAKHSRGMLFAMAGFLVTIWVTLIVAFIVLDNRLAAPAWPPPPAATAESLMPPTAPIP